ncbi:MAG TPA: hypothetical protein VG389_16430 [Myxococcota bacterium]|jgi:hypothetical protein|nr:hypothetical protein [Myxococcota bacterium]
MRGAAGGGVETRGAAAWLAALAGVAALAGAAPGCGPKHVAAGIASASLADVRGKDASAVKHLRALAENLREPPETREARAVLARAMLEHLMAWRLTARPALLLDTMALLGEATPAGEAPTPEKARAVAAAVHSTIAAWVSPTTDLAKLARALELEPTPAPAASDVVTVLRGGGPARAAARLLVLARAVEALDRVNPEGPRAATRLAADLGDAFPFPCPAVFPDLGRRLDAAAREAALHEGCAELCPRGDCWATRLADPTDAAYASPEALVLAAVLDWTAREAFAPLNDDRRGIEEELAEKEVRALLDRARAGVPAPLEFLLHAADEPAARWPVAVPGAALPAAAAFAVRGKDGWLAGARPALLVAVDGKVHFDVAAGARLAGIVPEDRIGEVLAAARASAPRAGWPAAAAPRVAIALPARALAEGLATALAAARGAGLAEAELLGTAIGGGTAVMAITPLEDTPARAGDLVVTDTALAVRTGAEMKVVDEDAPLLRAWDARPAAVSVRFDGRASVERVLAVAEELARDGVAVWVGKASDADVVDARNAAAEKPLVFTGSYAGAKLEIVRTRLDKAIRTCWKPEHGKGKVMVRLVVSMTGVVMDAHLPAVTFVDDKLLDCWTTRLKKLTLPAPAPAGLAEVEQSFEL